MVDGLALFFELGLMLFGFGDELEDSEEDDPGDESEDDDGGWFHVLIIGWLVRGISWWYFGGKGCVWGILIFY